MADYWATSTSPSGASYGNREHAPPPIVDDEAGVVYPPVEVLGITVGIVVATAILFVGTSDSLHWAGYGLGAFGTAATVVIYRHLDLLRRRNPHYVGKSWPQYATPVLVLIGICLGVLHAYFALQTTTIR